MARRAQRGSPTSSTRRQGPTWEASWQPCCSCAPFFFSIIDVAECAAHDFWLWEAERSRSLSVACTRGGALARGLLVSTRPARDDRRPHSEGPARYQLHRHEHGAPQAWTCPPRTRRRRTPPAASWCVGAGAAACSFMLLVSSMGSTGRGWRPTDISALSFILRIGVLGLQVLARARGGGGVGCSPTRPATTCSL